MAYGSAAFGATGLAVGLLVLARAVAVARSRSDAVELLIADDRPDAGALGDEATRCGPGLTDSAEFGRLAMADGAITLGEYRAMRAPIVARLDEIERLMADAGRVDMLGDLVRADEVAEVWDGLTLDRRCAVVDTLMTIRLHAVGWGTRTFHPATVEYLWKITTDPLIG